MKLMEFYIIECLILRHRLIEDQCNVAYIFGATKVVGLVFANSKLNLYAV
jgi:hypothetical protein